MIYALIALGYTMVYGVLKFINFAHGEVFTVGGYVAAFTLLALVPTQTVRHRCSSALWRPLSRWPFWSPWCSAF